MRKVLVIDTSVLCVWLKVPGKETCGPSKALVTYEMVSEKIEEEKKKVKTLTNKNIHVNRSTFHMDILF